MQAITHFLAGVLIARLLYRKLKHPWDTVLVLTLAFVSHIFLDALARATYHPAIAQLDSIAWWVFHAIVYLLSGVYALYYIITWLRSLKNKEIDREYYRSVLWAAIASVFIDIVDWGILRPLGWDHGWTMHQMPNGVYQNLMCWLPNLTQQPWAMVNELVLLALLGMGTYWKELASMIKNDDASLADSAKKQHLLEPIS